jgi:hypothetical protein
MVPSIDSGENCAIITYCPTSLAVFKKLNRIQGGSSLGISALYRPVVPSIASDKDSVIASHCPTSLAILKKLNRI